MTGAGNPYIGMRAFDYEQRAQFFGREQQSYALYRLTAFGFIAVIGASGSGKSSLVRAGLFPLLYDGKERTPWHIATMTPSGAPFERLAGAIAALGPDEDDDARTVRLERIKHLLRLSSSGIADALDEMPELADRSILLVVDQLEEIFRNAAPEARDETAAFVQLLLQLYRRRPSAHVLVTLRSDFIGDCAQFTGLPEAVSDTQYLVPSLSREQRRAAIVKPLAQTGAAIEPTLVERLLNDAGFENDQLPVLQHALTRMWIAAYHRDPAHTMLTDADYRDVGSLGGAISQHADEVTRGLVGLEHVVEAVFRALSERDPDGRAVRRILTLRQLVAETGLPETDVRTVVNRFRASDCGFLLPAGGGLTLETRIDVVHEALLRRWSSISASGAAQPGWLEREDDDGRYYRSLLARIDGGETTLQVDRVGERYAWWTSTPHTAAWAQRHGGRHERVEQFFADSLVALADFEAAAAQAEADERERRAQKERATRRFLIVSGSITAVALVLLIVTVFTLLGAERTTHESLVGQSNSFSRDAESAADRGDSADAVLLALAALPADLAHPDRPFTWPAYGALTDALANIRETHTYRTGGYYLRVHYSADGHYFVAWADGGMITVWKLGARRPTGVFQTHASTNDVEFSRDGKFIASGSEDGTIHLWNITSSKPLRVFKETEPVKGVVFRYDGRWLLASLRATTSVYDLRAARKIRSVPGIARNESDLSSQNDVVSRYDSELLLVDTRGSVTLWNATFSKRIRVWTAPLPVTDATQSEDGQHTAIAFGNLAPTLWDNRSGKELFRLGDDEGKILGLNFSRDGTVVAVGRRGSVQIWNVKTGKAQSTVPLRVDNEGYGLSADGRKLAVSSARGTIEIWSTSTGARSLLLAGHESYVVDVEYGPDGSRLLSSADDGTIREWDVATRVPRTLRVLNTPNNAMLLSNIAVSNDGAYFAVADQSVVTVYDSKSGQVLRALRNATSRQDVATFVAFTCNGRCLAISSKAYPGSVIWNWRAGVVKRRIRTSEHMSQLEFSADDEHVVSTANSVFRVRDAGNGRVVFRRRVPEKHIIGLHFSRDGRRVLLVTRSGAIRVYDARSGKSLVAFSAISDDLRDGNFSPDGSAIAIASRDRTVRIWNASTGSLIATRHCQGQVDGVSFTSDSKRVLIVALDSLRIWDIATGRTTIVFRGFDGYVDVAAFARKDTRVVTIGSDHTLRLWTVPQLPPCQDAIDLARRIVPHELSPTLASAEYITPRKRPSFLGYLSPQETCH